MRTPTALAALLLAALARPQYTDSMGYSYNNGGSALIGTMIQNNIRANMLRSSLMSSGTAGRILAGRKGPMGGPSAAFRPRPYPVESWLRSWSQGDPAKRKAVYAEWLRQKSIWEAETRARGTKRDDLAGVMATAFVLAYEAATGERASAAGYRTVVGEFRSGFAKDAALRGASNDRKNEIAEGALLDSTDAAMRRRAGDAAKAREGGVKFLDRWWKEGHDDAIALLAGKGSAPKDDFAAALKATSFRRVSPTLLPDTLRRSLSDPKQRQMSDAVTAKVLENVRQGLRENGAGDVPVDNVGRGVTYALMQLHQISLSTPGRPLGEGVRVATREGVVALRRKLLLNLAADPELARMTDRDKQLMTETLYFLPAFTELLYRAGGEKGDLAAQKTARDVARKTFQSLFGQTPESLRFDGS